MYCRKILMNSLSTSLIRYQNKLFSKRFDRGDFKILINKSSDRVSLNVSLFCIIDFIESSLNFLYHISKIYSYCVVEGANRLLYISRKNYSNLFKILRIIYRYKSNNWSHQVSKSFAQIIYQFCLFMQIIWNYRWM